MKSLKLIGLTLLAIVVGFVATSCGGDKEKDEPTPKTSPVLGLIYGFSEDYFNCFDIEIHYTDASGATKTEKITKTNCEKETVNDQEIYFYSNFIEYAKYPMDNVNYGVVFTCKDPADEVKESYNLTFGYSISTIAAGQSYDKATIKSKVQISQHNKLRADQLKNFCEKQLNNSSIFKGKTYKITSNGKFEEQ